MSCAAAKFPKERLASNTNPVVEEIKSFRCMAALHVLMQTNAKLIVGTYILEMAETKACLLFVLCEPMPRLRDAFKEDV
jgi:hypothetical protein